VKIGQVSEEKVRVDLNVVQVVASALAAVSSAVLLSTVGVAGTLIGAAVGSVIATVASAVYSYSLQASRQRVAAAQAAALARVGRSRRAGQQAVLDPEDPEIKAAARPRLGEALGKLPWKRISLVTAGVFAAAMVAIVSFELIAGRSVSTITHGTDGNGASTSIPGLGKANATPTRTPTETPTTATPSATPSESVAPSPSAASSPSVTPSEPPPGAVTPTPSPSANATPTPAPTPTPTASADASDAAGADPAAPTSSAPVG
jgi:hypothetical protein